MQVFFPLVPAEAGIQRASVESAIAILDSRLRGNERSA
jgi:hypothetical protein